MSAKEKAIEDLIIPFDELLESYIQNLRNLEKKPSTMRIKKESDLTLSGGNPQDDSFSQRTVRKIKTNILTVP